MGERGRKLGKGGRRVSVGYKLEGLWTSTDLCYNVHTGEDGGEPGKEGRRVNVEYEFERLWTSADLCYNIDMGGEGVKLDSLNNFCS